MLGLEADMFKNFLKRFLPPPVNSFNREVNRIIDNFHQEVNRIDETLNSRLGILNEINNLKQKLNKTDSDVVNKSNDIVSRIIRLTPQPFLWCLAIDLTEHCNLNCYGCDHFSCVAKEEYMDYEQYKKDIERLSELTGGLVGYFSMAGGEPLLHPKIVDFCVITRKFFPKSNIWLVTNGLLLLKQDESFWKTFAENNIEIHPTKYPVNTKWDEIEKLAKKNGVYLEYFNNAKVAKTMKQTVIDLKGMQHPVKQFSICHRANNCIVLKNGKIYPCPITSSIGNFNYAFNQNLELSENDYIDIYKVKDYKEILEFCAKPVPFCRYCRYDKFKSIDEWRASSRTIEEFTIPFDEMNK